MGLVEPLPDLATLLGTDIDDLDLTVRAYNLLRREGVCTVGDLVNLTESDLLGFHNSQPKCVDEMQCKLQVIGFSLRSERDPGDVIGDDPADVWDAHADGLLGKTRRRRGGRRESKRIARARRRAAIGPYSQRLKARVVRMGDRRKRSPTLVPLRIPNRYHCPDE